MKKNKEWLKEQIKDEEVELKYAFDNYVPYEKVLIVDDVNDLLDKLEEPELSVIPQFVAEAIEKYKESDDSLGELLASVEHANIKYYHGLEKYRVDFDNLYEPVVDLCAIIARAWLDGYSVEEEKRYRVKLGNVYVGKENSKYCYDFQGAHTFTNKGFADECAERVGGIVEEVTE